VGATELGRGAERATGGGDPRLRPTLIAHRGVSYSVRRRATDEQIERIEKLVGEEHRLWEPEAHGEATEGDRRRLDDLR
jgi:hypothetical protein